MSNLVSSKVHKKVFGSATRKAVMIYFADKASDGGEGIWASKTTISAELEMHRATVIRTINELVSDGILIVVGGRKHPNGVTVEYDIAMDVVGALPDVDLPRSSQGARDAGNRGTRSATLPVAQRDPSHSATPPVAQRDTMMSHSATQTILEPSLNHDDDDRRASADLTFREKVLDAMGLGPDGIAGPSKIIGSTGDMAEAQRWLGLPGLTEDLICTEIRKVMAVKRDGPPSSFRYFTKAMQKLSGEVSAPALAPIGNIQNRGGLAGHGITINPEDFPE